MTTNDGPIGETLARLESIQEEVRPDRELSWRAGDSCDEAFRAAWQSALMGAIPTLLLVAMLAAVHVAPVDRLLARAVNVATLVGGSVLYVLAVGFVSGRVAHRFAYETDVSAPLLARLIAWVANLCLWGWAVVLVFLVLTHP